MYRIAFFPPNKQYGPSRQISDALLKQALSVTDNKSTIKGYDSVLPEHILYIGINTQLYISSACHLLEHPQRSTATQSQKIIGYVTKRRCSTYSHHHDHYG